MVEQEVLLFVTKVLVLDLYLIEKVLDVLDVFQVLLVLELVLVLANMKKYLYLTQVLWKVLDPNPADMYGIWGCLLLWMTFIQLSGCPLLLVPKCTNSIFQQSIVQMPGCINVRLCMCLLYRCASTITCIMSGDWDWEFNKLTIILQSTFSSMKIFVFQFDFTEIYSQGLIWQQVSIDSGNDLMPKRQQAITWTNGNQFTDAVWYQRLLMPYGISRPRWVNSLRPSDAYMRQ